MGYCIQYHWHTLRIPAEQVAAALAAIQSLYQPAVMEQRGTASRYDPQTQRTIREYRASPLPPGGFIDLIAALQAWAFAAEQQADGSLEVTAFLSDKVGDEAVLFEALAPFLDASLHPVIEARQDNDEVWRHTFCNGEHRRVPGKVVYADDYPELFRADLE